MLLLFGKFCQITSSEAKPGRARTGQAGPRPQLLLHIPIMLRAYAGRDLSVSGRGSPAMHPLMQLIDIIFQSTAQVAGK